MARGLIKCAHGSPVQWLVEMSAGGGVGRRAGLETRVVRVPAVAYLHGGEGICRVAQHGVDRGEDLARGGHGGEHERVELRQRVVHKVLPDGRLITMVAAHPQRLRERRAERLLDADALCRCWDNLVGHLPSWRLFIR